MIKIGIIGAMELEVEALKAKMSTTQIITKAGMSFYEGSLNGVDVVIVRSGVGKVNAALCTQILADCFCVSHIINTGVAGSLNASLDIGDILISRDALHFLPMSSWLHSPRRSAMKSTPTSMPSSDVLSAVISSSLTKL